MAMIFRKQDLAAFKAFLEAEGYTLEAPQKAKREVLRVWLKPKSKNNREPDTLKTMKESKTHYAMSDWLGCLAFRFYNRRIAAREAEACDES